MPIPRQGYALMPDQWWLPHDCQTNPFISLSLAQVFLLLLGNALRPPWLASHLQHIGFMLITGFRYACCPAYSESQALFQFSGQRFFGFPCAGKFPSMLGTGNIFDVPTPVVGKSLTGTLNTPPPALTGGGEYVNIANAGIYPRQ